MITLPSSEENPKEARTYYVMSLKVSLPTKFIGTNISLQMLTMEQPAPLQINSATMATLSTLILGQSYQVMDNLHLIKQCKVTSWGKANLFVRCLVDMPSIDSNFLCHNQSILPHAKTMAEKKIAPE